MSHVYLGKLTLFWCDTCNVPVLGKKCAKCGCESRRVEVTPPGDIRPAFPFDLDLINRAIAEGFGHEGLLQDKIAVLNKAPYEDRLDEIYVDGRMFGAVRFDPVRLKWTFMPRAYSAKQMKITKGYVIADKGAEKPLLGSCNMLGPGVVDCDENIQIDDEVIVLMDGNPIAMGRAKMTGADMKLRKKGVAVKTRWNGYDDTVISAGGQTWDDAIVANTNYLDGFENEAISFTKKTVAAHADLPVTVSYSGGKDSLATLLIVKKAVPEFDVMYIDTGLEFPETTENVHQVAEQYALKLKIAEAESFWAAAPKFGPPSVEARWCCKVCKLGPITNLIETSYPGGCLSFIGQRRYESEVRAKSQRVWQNPWVGNQTSASPIQNWTALHIWLYLFREKAPYNPLYGQGFDRIGCWLCPSASLADYEYVKQQHPEMWQQWEAFLLDYCRKVGLSPGYVTYGLWRWKRLPPQWEEVRNTLGITTTTPEGKVETLDFSVVCGHRPCKDGSVSAEGSFDAPLDMGRLEVMLRPLGEVRSMDGVIFIPTAGEGSIQVFATGTVVSRGKDEAAVGATIRKAELAIRRGMLCTGCGVCVGACPINAITKEDHKATIGEGCNACGECIAICPLVKFRRSGE